MSTQIDHLLTNSAAAKMLSVSPRQLVALREAGAIPYVKISDSPKSFRYSALALSDFIAKRQQRNEQATAKKKGAK